jgi:hypothetical protein
MTRKILREEKEKTAQEKKGAAVFPGWDALEEERIEPEPGIWLMVSDQEGRLVRRIPGATSAGFHRVAWDLRYPAPDAVELVESPLPLWGEPPRGLMIAPGEYMVSLASQVDGETRLLSEPQSFEVTVLRKGALEGSSPEDVARFWRRYESSVRTHTAMKLSLARLIIKVERMARVIENSRVDLFELDPRFHELRKSILELDSRFSGHRSKKEPGEKAPPTIGDRLASVARGVDHSTYGPTATHHESLEVATSEMAELRAQLESYQGQVSELVRELIEAGAPWIEGEPLSSLGD